MTRAAAVVVASAMLLAGCPGRVVVPRPDVPIDGRRFLSDLDVRRGEQTGLRARAKLRSGVAGMWAREAVVVERPRSVRVDVLSPFGLAIALGTDGSSIWLYPPSEGVRYEGRATPENIARFLGAPVSVEDLVDILLGFPPRREPKGMVVVTWQDGLWQIEVPHAGGRQALLVDPETGWVREAIEHRGDRAGDVRVRFFDHQDGFPHAIDVSAPALEVEARLRYAEIEHDPVVDASVFRGPTTVPTQPLEVVHIAE